MSSGLIHNFYQREMNQHSPVHLLLDTDLSKGKIELSTYHGFQINFGEKGLQQHFLPLQNEYLVYDQDKVACTSSLPARIESPVFLLFLQLMYLLSRPLSIRRRSLT